MKTLRWVLFAGALSCFVLPVSVGSADAVALPTIISLDETNFLQGVPFSITEGAAILCEGAASATGTCSLSDIAVFSTPANISVVATYSLPSSLHIAINGLTTTSAALLISDASGGADSVSDLIPTNVTTGAGAKADILSSNGANTPVIFLPETVNENGSELITYIPTTGQPGFSPGVVLAYSITSDSAVVPEPTSLLLLGTGILGLPVMRRFGRKADTRSS